LPEFARMSRRPGIGVGFMHDVASALMETGLSEKMVDVPLTLQHGTMKLPLGRFLRRKLRTFIGKDEKAPEILGLLQAEELRTMRETAFNNSTPFREEILKASLGTRINMEARHNLKRRKGNL